jgi:hypothetical protein
VHYLEQHAPEYKQTSDPRDPVKEDIFISGFSSIIVNQRQWEKNNRQQEYACRQENAGTHQMVYLEQSGCEYQQQ